MPSGGRKKKSGRRPGPGRPMPPSEETGEEARYVKEIKESSTPLTVYLKNGEEVRGTVEYFDRDVVKITRGEGPHFLVRKEEIRYWVEDDER